MQPETPISTSHRSVLTRVLHVAVLSVVATAHAAAQSPQAVEPCTPVGGAVMTNFIRQDTTLGTATGDLAGAVSATLLGVVPAGDGTVVFTVQHHWTTEAGDTVFVAVAEATATQIAPNLFAVLSYPVSITGGTGRYEGATGTVSNIGSVDLNTGRTIFRYQGEVCFRGPLR